MNRCVRVRACAVAMALCALGAGAALARSPLSTWATILNERHGFSIAYSVDIFEQKEPSKTDEGRLLVSRDGKAKLLVGAFENSDNQTLMDYRAYLISTQYAGAKMAYAPLRERWFVLSGEHGGEIFYQRVAFTCGGKLINSWVMLFPAEARRKYDRVVEAVARSFTPGTGRTGACD